MARGKAKVVTKAATPKKAAPKTPAKAAAKTTTAKKKDCKHGTRNAAGNCPKAPCKHGERGADGKCPPAAKKTAAAKLVDGAAKRHRKVLRDNIQGLSKPAILRLAMKGGAVSVNGLVYEEMRGVIKVFMEEVIKNATIMTEYAKRKTIMKEDILAALERHGQKVYWSGAKRLGKCAVPKGKKILTKVREIQSQSECVYFSVAPFRRLIKEIMNDYSHDALLSNEAASIMQVATEDYVVGLFEHAQLQALHAGRKGIQPKNIQIARLVRGERS